MNSREIQELQELYSEVYEEKSGFPRPTFMPKSRERNIGPHDDWKDKTPTEWGDKTSEQKKADKLKSRASAVVQTQRRQDRETGVAEDYNFYDVILSHLLDEGYADTEQAAEAIMVNMSEDWRESIVEEVLDERKYEADEKLPGSGKTPNEKMQRAQGKHGANYMSARGDLRFRGNPKNSYHSRGRKVMRIKDIIASGEDPRNSTQVGIGWGNDARKIGRPGDRPEDRTKKTNRTEDDDAKSTHTQGGLRAHKTKAGGYRTLKKKEG